MTATYAKPGPPGVGRARLRRLAALLQRSVVRRLPAAAHGDAGPMRHRKDDSDVGSALKGVGELGEDLTARRRQAMCV